jgi:8-oxo-dGTP pyrophosphatase MutT (NUDIX family)
VLLIGYAFDPMEEATVRRAARVLVLDEDRVLLFRCRSSARPGHFSWLTPGGGLEGAEDVRAGAARELAEETGLVAPPAAFVGPVFEEEIEYPTSSGRQRQSQQYLVLHHPAFEIDRSAQTEWEREFMTEARWWTAAELRATAETVYPPNLADLIESQVAAPVVAKEV